MQFLISNFFWSARLGHLTPSVSGAIYEQINIIHQCSQQFCILILPEFFSENVKHFKFQFKKSLYQQLQCYMTTIFKNYDTNICVNSSYLFYDQNINISHSIRPNSDKTQCYSIIKLNGSLKLFPEFSLIAMISQEISLSFPGFAWFFHFFKFFPNFPGFTWVLWTLYIIYNIILYFQPSSSENLVIRNCQFNCMVLLVYRWKSIW